MYGIDITLTTGKTITVHGLTEIRVQDEQTANLYRRW